MMHCKYRACNFSKIVLRLSCNTSLVIIRYLTLLNKKRKSNGELVVKIFLKLPVCITIETHDHFTICYNREILIIIGQELAQIEFHD